MNLKPNEIVTTKDFPTNPKCLLLIQGTGAVRLGQCINENLKLGSMIPYVEKGIKYNFSIIIFNPNERKDFFNEKKTIDKYSIKLQINILSPYFNSLVIRARY